MKFFSGLRKSDSSRQSRKGPDGQFGTGLWRHNRDRFIRAVDRYYTTALAIHEAQSVAPLTTRSESEIDPGETTSAVELIANGTHRLNDLVPIIDDITTRLNADHPIEGQVVPASARLRVGDSPELLTRASSKVAEAVLAASMARTELLAGRPISSSAQACDRFIADAVELLERVRGNLARPDRP